ncbi:cupin domain-containing protein [Sinomonas sp. JGH33]|uniref:Cupin domain-containing protein n=1 Tax=Sinomonas terricola TaxID=3110330 RepID=A0ABU5T8G7_9MICC|nr:cupin domain-containing protein [Sinomonas sp. JGH33]MEA5455964.1 cupin domain-containing protein [Sinomonas sp. JGH33]
MSSLGRGRAAEGWIKRLGLTPSSVGGWFGAAMASDETVDGAALPARFTGPHPLYSSNWYLLEEGQHLLLHQLKQDELWFFHVGGPLLLHSFPDSGAVTVAIGPDPERGETLHAAAPHSTWFGAELARGTEFALVSCSLGPGWQPSDPTLPTDDDVARLCAQFPEREVLIRRLAAGA